MRSGRDDNAAGDILPGCNAFRPSLFRISQSSIAAEHKPLRNYVTIADIIMEKKGHEIIAPFSSAGRGIYFLGNSLQPGTQFPDRFSAKCRRVLHLAIIVEIHVANILRHPFPRFKSPLLHMERPQRNALRPSLIG